ncbi:protein of unknown function [Saccharopolyspora antimicrobica]|uniref:Uncharacterized protein DUF397 n=1 Tax=Saccharopolyspora antimicrobica TaxID=455193 RepID=A0A1I4ZN08_9PSEU|nr:DUF397 domain-containing protein [Saccharopolyspora antimicrobica]RKT83467.1 uncharacterized protein DUF397 [Saccharopolyspora antimicrobica]SFN51577.1 protein of unknown function [Saccharopolyspora antimicrobica]
MDGITRWRKSSRSNGNGGMCVEVGGGAGIVGVRDTKDRDGGTLAFDRRSWSAFLGAIKGQRFDLP